MKENAHSIRVWKILQTFGGMKMTRWNLTGWLVYNQRIVQFILKTDNFHGVVTVEASTQVDKFIVAYADFRSPFTKAVEINANYTPTFIETLCFGELPQEWKAGEQEVKGERAPVTGERAPYNENPPCGASSN